MKSIIFFITVACVIAYLHLKRNSDAPLYSFSKERVVRLRGILCIMIILCHTSFTNSEMRGWGSPVVAMFMFISGYGLSSSFHEKGRLYIRNFFRNRTMTVFIPLFITTILHVISMRLCKLHYFGDFIQDIKTARMPIGATWYVYMILYYYCAFQFSAIIGRKYRNLLVLMIAFSLLYFCLMHFVLKWEYWAEPSFVLIFGMIYQKFELQIKELIKKNSKIVLFLIPFLAISLYWISYNSHYQYFIYMFFPVLVVWLIYFIGFYDSFFLKGLGVLSFDLYLIHDSVISHILPLNLNHYVYVITVFVITMAIAFYFNKLRTGIDKKLINL